jgi:capsular exopolysaccharide synthesis family protein
MNSKPQIVSLDSLEIDLQQYWLVIVRRWLPASGAFFSILLLAILFASSQKPVYKAQGKLLLKADRTVLFTGIGKDTGEFSPLTLQSSPLKTETEVILSTPLLEKTITLIKSDNLDSLNAVDLNLESLMLRLKVTSVAGADVLVVAFEDKDPKTAALVINELMKAYINNNIAANKAKSAEAREFIAQQLPKSEAKVQQIDAEFRRFKEQNEVTNLEEESKALVSNASALNTDIIKASTDLGDVTARSNALQSKLGLNSETAIAISSLSQSTGIQQALKELQDTQNQLAIQRSLYEEQYSTVVNLKEKEAELQNLLKKRVAEIVGRPQAFTNASLQIGATKQSLIEKFVNTEVERLGLTSRVAILSNEVNFYQNRAGTLPRLEQEQKELQRRLEVSQSTYSTLLKRLQELEVAEQQITGNAQIIEMASIPTSPIPAKKIITLVVGTILALVVAIIIMIILESRDQSIKTVKEIRQLFDCTWLGTIPKFGKVALPSKKATYPVPSLPVRDLPQSPISATYRILQAQLKLLNTNQKFKTFVVTSSVPKEGKSTIAANLAATIAYLGQKVLLIDTDLYHPKQHKIWNLSNDIGLTNAIAGEVDLAKALHTVINNLDVLTAGVLHPNPLAVLNSKAMQELINSGAKSYDFVILDTSPIIVGAEAMTLCGMTDGLLLVARPQVLDFPSARIAKKFLQYSGQNVLGVVANCATSDDQPNQLDLYIQKTTQDMTVSK